MTTKRLAALEAGDPWDFFANDSPKCPHCGDDYSINDSDAWELYQEGEHEIKCPGCDHTYTATAQVSFSYSTNEQEDEDDGQ